MIKWIIIAALLIFAWCSGWRIHLEALTHKGPAKVFARTGHDYIANLNPSQTFDDVTGNAEREKRAIEQMR